MGEELVTDKHVQQSHRVCRSVTCSVQCYKESMTHI